MALAFTFGSHAAIFKGFRSVRAAGHCSTQNWPSYFAAHAGWPGKEREEFQLQGPSIIEGFRRLGYITVGSGAVGWFDPATETGRCLTDEFDEFFYPGSTWQLAEQLAWINAQRSHVPPGQPLLLFLNVGETHVPYWHTGAPWDREDNPCVPFQQSSHERRRTCRRRQRACLEHVDALLADLLEDFAMPPLFSPPIMAIAGRRRSLGAWRQPSPHFGSTLLMRVGGSTGLMV